MKVMKVMKVMKAGKPGEEKGEGKQEQKTLNKGNKGMKRPASVLNAGDEEPMSLDDKIELWQKKSNWDCDQFLSALSKGQREALWQRFAAARKGLKQPELLEAWDKHCKGQNSTENKKALLKEFVKAGGDLKKSESFVKELVKLQEVKGEKSTSEWVPFATILKRFRLSEAMRRVRKGSIRTRKDPADEEEWEFQVVKNVEYKRHEVVDAKEATKSGKLEVEQYMKLRSKGALMECGENDGLEALQSVVPGKRKGLQAIMDKEPEDAEGDEEKEGEDEGGEGKGSSTDKKKDGQVVEADLLSDQGIKKNEAKRRLEKMLDLVKKVQKDCKNKAVAAEMKKTVADLEKAVNKKKSLEEVKKVLYDAAFVVKKAKKMWPEQGLGPPGQGIASPCKFQTLPWTRAVVVAVGPINDNPQVYNSNFLAIMASTTAEFAVALYKGFLTATYPSLAWKKRKGGSFWHCRGFLLHRGACEPSSLLRQPSSMFVANLCPEQGNWVLGITLVKDVHKHWPWTRASSIAKVLVLRKGCSQPCPNGKERNMSKEQKAAHPATFLHLGKLF